MDYNGWSNCDRKVNQCSIMGFLPLLSIPIWFHIAAAIVTKNMTKLMRLTHSPEVFIFSSYYYYQMSGNCCQKTFHICISKTITIFGVTLPRADSASNARHRDTTDHHLGSGMKFPILNLPPAGFPAGTSFPYGTPAVYADGT